MEDYTTTYFDSKTWEILLFFIKSLFIGVLLIGVVGLMEKYVFDQTEENTKKDFTVYIIKSVFYIFLVFILSMIFGYQYLYIGILLIVLIFLLSFYSIPLGISRVQTWYLKKNYKLHLEMFAIRKKEDEKWGQIKKGFIDQITGKYNNILAKKIKPKISITERIKTDKDENQLLLLFIEVWLKKDEAKAIKFDFIEHLISQEAEILSIENYQRQKFHVEQETK